MGLNVAASSANLTGVISFHAATAGQPGWLRLDGRTIGSAASGATSRANGDTFALFAYLWANYGNAALPIQDSAGAASVRGASAAADFTANKRLPLHAPDGDFLRVLDSTGAIDVGRGQGTHQAGQFPAHTHGIRTNAEGGSGGITGNVRDNFNGIGPVGGQGTESAGGTSNASENRPPNTAFPLFIHL